MSPTLDKVTPTTTDWDMSVFASSAWQLSRSAPKPRAYCRPQRPARFLTAGLAAPTVYCRSRCRHRTLTAQPRHSSLRRALGRPPERADPAVHLMPNDLLVAAIALDLSAPDIERLLNALLSQLGAFAPMARDTELERLALPRLLSFPPEVPPFKPRNIQFKLPPLIAETCVQSDVHPLKREDQHLHDQTQANK